MSNANPMVATAGNIPPSGPARRRFQRRPARNDFLAVVTSELGKLTALPGATSVSKGSGLLVRAAAFPCSLENARRADLWDDNDHLVGTPKYLIILNEDFTYKGQVNLINWGGMGFLDWFSDGSVMMAQRYPNNDSVPIYQFCSRSGALAPASFRTMLLWESLSYGDIKVAPRNQGFYGSSLQLGARWSGLVKYDNYTRGVWGSCAVVPKTDSTFEIWSGSDEDGGITVTPLASDGHLAAPAELSAGRISAASAFYDHIHHDGGRTMAYDPIGHRVLYPFGNGSSAKPIHTVNAATKQLVRAYSRPVGNRPPASYVHGVAAGEKGEVVATEFNYTYDQQSRSGLDVRDEDGSNYRFIRFARMAAATWLSSSALTDYSFRYLSNPSNNLWTGNSPEIRDEAGGLWRYLYFGQTKAGGNAADNADPHKDGISNLLERAFNFHPLQPGVRLLTPTAGTSGLPVISTHGSGPGVFLRIEYIRRRPDSNPGLGYDPQFAGDPGDVGPGGWAEPTGGESVEEIDDLWERVRVECSPGDPRKFGRVRASAP